MPDESQQIVSDDDRQNVRDDWRQHRGAWIGAAATVAAAVISAIVTGVVTSGPDTASDTYSGGTVTATATVTITAAPGKGGDAGDVQELPDSKGPASKSQAPALAVEPDTGTAGDKATVRGSGFKPGERVRLEDNQTAEGIRDTTVKQDGTFAVEIIIPEGWHFDESEELGAHGLTSNIRADTVFRATES
ncbi:hypothetical protein [Streptomyces boninensis]|uniref:hypothetical protein n=1 Tax=Streptomyces boninensis TaxID=2039455 RepID=UPI003B21715A